MSLVENSVELEAADERVENIVSTLVTVFVKLYPSIMLSVKLETYQVKTERIYISH